MDTNIREKTIDEKHSYMVFDLVKKPEVIAQTINHNKIDMIHAVLGIAGEAGELVDAIKKNVIYNKELDITNIIEELGDIEFYMEQLRQRLGITRNETLEANMSKLAKRYKGVYSDDKAQARADKAGV